MNALAIPMMTMTPGNEFETSQPNERAAALGQGVHMMAAGTVYPTLPKLATFVLLLMFMLMRLLLLSMDIVPQVARVIPHVVNPMFGPPGKVLVLQPLMMTELPDASIGGFSGYGDLALPWMTLVTIAIRDPVGFLDVSALTVAACCCC